ncbi:HPP family protein [Halomarina litorea]|uniref:HPP family protein n=1 Tax=Halomarina litorea TaxID=2961595 RepID=UPI0020C54097|nr:HPP family protein [Halomarina sp. BCD28]
MCGRRVREAFRRLRRIERREVREFRVWLEHTRNLVHLSVLLFVPLLIALVTAISNAVPAFSFLLFPPLASGTYTLFANPSGRYSSPTRFVAGLTVGAACGWVAFEVGRAFSPVAPMSVDVAGAALSVFLTAVVTWGFDIEEPAAFSSALLVLVADIPGDAPQPFGVSGRSIYVLSIAASSALIAAAFVLWRRKFYRERARYLYQSTKGDDHVLVPLRGPDPDETAMLAARLAAAHDAGKVVLMDLVSEETIDEASRVAEGRTDPDGEAVASDGGIPSDAGGDVETVDEAEREAAAIVADDLESRAAAIRSKVGVPCEVVVATEGANPADTVVRTAHETNCDLIAAAYETEDDHLSGFLRALFGGDVDVVVHRSSGGRQRWKRVLVPVRKAGDTAHEMVDFATRLAGRTGRVAVCHCIDSESRRRDAEGMLADIVETVSAACETRVSRQDIADFLDSNAPSYDLVIIGSSGDRTAASRFISRPTFERVQNLECDVVILDRNYRG